MNTTTLDRAIDTEMKPHVAGSIRDIKKFILDRYREQSEEFSNASARMARKQFRSQYPTEIIAFKCMDGRLNLSVWTETPVGIIQPYRTLGGKFDLGWPLLAEYLTDQIDSAIQKGIDSALLSTYHFSKGDTHRCCAGHGYDTKAAMADATKRVEQAGKVFGRPYRAIHPVLVGMETDDEALIFHGENGETFAVADALDMAPEELDQRFIELYPEMRSRIRAALLERVKGNQRHIKKIRAANRQPVELQHQEQVIGVGRGFDTLHLPNTLLIVGPYDSKWTEGVVTAGKIILSNLKDGRVDPEAGRMLLVAKHSREERGSMGWNFAEQEALSLKREALEALKKGVPELLDDYFCALSGVVEEQTRQLYLVD